MARTSRRLCAGPATGPARRAISWSATIRTRRAASSGTGRPTTSPRPRTGLEEGYGAESLGDGFKQAVNDFGKPGYGGPCPPKGHGAQHYHFRLMALAVETLPVAPSASCAEVEAIAERHAIGEVELVGIYGR